MMELIVGTKDLSEVVEKITWKGDTRQVARTLEFSIVQKSSDKHLPKVTLAEGNDVLLKEDGVIIFGGILFDISVSAASGLVTYTAFDLMFYINNSEISKVFDDTPENIAAWVCNYLVIPFGSVAKTGITVYSPCLGKKAYDAIMSAYTAASRKNGKKYIPLMKKVNQLHVIEKGQYCGVVLEGTYNLEDASYRTSLQPMVNRVLITDKNGNPVRTVESSEFPTDKYGIVQKVYKQQDGKDDDAEAKALMQGIEQSGSVTALSDTRAVSGYGIAIQEPVSGLYGFFYIESDTHMFVNGKGQMQLTLAFQNMMDEKELDKTEKETA